MATTGHLLTVQSGTTWLSGRKGQRLPLPPLLDAMGALDSSFDASQFLPVTGDGVIGGGQQRSQLCLSQQVTLDLQDQPVEHGAICIGHATQITCAWLVCAVQKCTRRPVSTLRRYR